MTLVVTGRSVLGALYANGGEAMLDALPAKLGADEAAILRMIQSLSAARLISAPGPAPQRITLTEAGRKWCATELASAAAEGSAKPAPAAAPAPAAPSRMSLFPDPRSSEVRQRPQDRHHDRMRNVDVVRVKPRNPANPRSLRLDELVERAQSLEKNEQAAATPLPTVPASPAPEPEPATAPAPQARPAAPLLAVAAPAELSEPVPVVPAAQPAPESQADQAAKTPRRPRKAKPPETGEDGERISVDRNGFVTHINGRRIF